MNKRILEINKLRNKKEYEKLDNTSRVSRKLLQEQKNKNNDLKINSVLSGLNFDDSIKQTKKRIKLIVGVVGVVSFIAYFGLTVFLCWTSIFGMFYLLALCEGGSDHSIPMSRSARQINIDVNKENKYTN